MEEQTQVFDSVDIERVRNSDGESEIVFVPRQAAGKIQERGEKVLKHAQQALAR